MTRIRKEPNRYWSKENKLKIINELLTNCKSSYEVSKDYDISSGIVKVNIKMYKKLKIKMYKKFTQFCIVSDVSESIFNLSFNR